MEWQRGQSGCKGRTGGEAESGRPTLNTGSSAQQRRCGARAAAREQPNELSFLGRAQGRQGDSAGRGEARGTFAPRQGARSGGQPGGVQTLLPRPNTHCKLTPRVMLQDFLDGSAKIVPESHTVRD